MHVFTSQRQTFILFYSDYLKEYYTGKISYPLGKQ